MEYISAKEAAERWGIQVRGVQELCKAGRIQGAFKFERSWMIPASAKKPEDPRRTARKDSRTVSYGDYPSLIAYCTRMSPGSLSGIPIGITSPAAIRQFNAEQLYYTGELDACREMLRSGGADPETLLSRLRNPGCLIPDLDLKCFSMIISNSVEEYPHSFKRFSRR